MRFSFLISLLTWVTCQTEDFDPFTECLVPDLNVACSNQCEIDSLDCFAKCDANDTLCWSQCLRENTECIKNCPCEANCLDGCVDCANPICSCEVIEENPDWNRCIDENSLTLGRCVYNCENNEECENDCLARFKTKQANCPCEENCSTGCPCSDFECLAPTSVPITTTTSTTTTPISPTGNAVLVIRSYLENNYKPFIVDFNGNINDDLDFEYGDNTRIYWGCGATLHNVFWYFGGGGPGGGEAYVRQVSKIVGCKLERQVGAMEFDCMQCSCNTYNQPDSRILLCFDYYNKTQCHTFDGESFQSVTSSEYSHSRTYGMGNYHGKALTTGCYGNQKCGVKTELMDMNTLTWSAGPDYPFIRDSYPFPNYISHYSTASTSEAVYIIGGEHNEDIIAEFRDGFWRQVGTLAKGRDGHGSITLNGETMVLGGRTTGGDAETEIWDFINGSNRLIDPTLGDREYMYGIGLYIVPFDFCST